MGNLNYLNLGCGSKFHRDWVNIDLQSNSEYVIAANLLNGIPCEDNSFEVIYHSQVLEHIPKERAKDFIRECYRVLKPNGIVRVVVPDLENIVDEYKKLLSENLNSPSELSEANYDWIMLEMYDQSVRNYSGGLMGRYLQQDKLINEEYVINRIGYIGRLIRNNFLRRREIIRSLNEKSTSNHNEVNKVVHFFRKVIWYAKRKIKFSLFDSRSESLEFRLGKFRLGGEIHMWMYDRYSLTRLLKDCGFSDIKIMNPHTSDIPNWELYELDVKDGMVFDPTSLFVEAKKELVETVSNKLDSTIEAL